MDELEKGSEEEFLEEDNIEDDNIPPEDEDEPLDEVEKGDKDKTPNFMDPNEVPDELKPAFKAMQGAFTRGMQSIAGEKEKVAFVEKLLDNPDNAMNILAEFTGKEVKTAPNAEPKADSTETTKWVKDMAREAVKDQMDGMGKELAGMKVKLAESYLDLTYPDWTLYEDVMADILREHPTMGQDLDKLYAMAKGNVEEVDKLISNSKKTSKTATKPSSGRHESKGLKVATNIDEAIAIAAKEHGVDPNTL